MKNFYLWVTKLILGDKFALVHHADLQYVHHLGVIKSPIKAGNTRVSYLFPGDQYDATDSTPETAEIRVDEESVVTQNQYSRFNINVFKYVSSLLKAKARLISLK